MFRLLRARQWTKNLLLFAALIFARELFDADSVLLAFLGFAASGISALIIVIGNGRLYIRYGDYLYAYDIRNR